jgi:hypothetical protein
VQQTPAGTGYGGFPSFQSSYNVTTASINSAVLFFGSGGTLQQASVATPVAFIGWASACFPRGPSGAGSGSAYATLATTGGYGAAPGGMFGGGDPGGFLGAGQAPSGVTGGIGGDALDGTGGGGGGAGGNGTGGSAVRGGNGGSGWLQLSRIA